MQGILPKKYVSVIKIKDDYYVLGLSENSITLIDKIDAEKINFLPEENNQTINANFAELLKQKLKLK